MSTNFYARTPDTAPGDEGLHIGQHSPPKEFLFRAHDDLGLTDCAAWHEFLSRPGVRIVADHGVEHTLDEFWRQATLRPPQVGGPNVMSRRWPGGPHRNGEYTDQHGHPFAGYEFH